MTPHDRFVAPVGEADEAQLARLLSGPDDIERGLQVGIVGAEVAVVEVVDVDDISAQVAQRAVDALAHEVRVVGVRVAAARVADLGRQKQAVARHGASADEVADERLGAAVAVDIGRVPMRDAELEGAHSEALADWPSWPDQPTSAPLALMLSPP